MHLKYAFDTISKPWTHVLIHFYRHFRDCNFIGCFSARVHETTLAHSKQRCSAVQINNNAHFSLAHGLINVLYTFVILSLHANMVLFAKIMALTLFVKPVMFKNRTERKRKSL